MFAPVAFGLNPGQKDEITEDVTSIGLIGVPNPAMSGPYVPAGSSTVQDVYGLWLGKLEVSFTQRAIWTSRLRPKQTNLPNLGPTPEPFGFSLEFSIVGPNPPVEGSEGGGEVATQTEPNPAKWKRVDFEALSLSELKCAEKQLNEAKETFKDNSDVSTAI